MLTCKSSYEIGKMFSYILDWFYNVIKIIIMCKTELKMFQENCDFFVESGSVFLAAG